MTVNNVAALQRAQDNCCRLLLLVQEVIATPTQSNIDAVVAAGEGTGSLVPQPSYGLDGETYDWPGYQESLLRQIDRLQSLIIKLGGTFLQRSQGSV
jgi:hypothetical protein